MTCERDQALHNHGGACKVTNRRLLAMYDQGYEEGLYKALDLIDASSPEADKIRETINAL